MILIDNFIRKFSDTFAGQKDLPPWIITNTLSAILWDLLSQLDSTYEIKDGVAIHKSVIIDANVVLKAPVILCENCLIGPNAYLRGGVYLGKAATIGPSCEIKTSIIFCDSSIAHFNFIGDSIIGNHVNFEAGSLTANHYNERKDKKISVTSNSTIIDTGTEKFGALVGDHSRIGANAVLSPGTILPANSIVKRLELIEQQLTKKTKT